MRNKSPDKLPVLWVLNEWDNSLLTFYESIVYTRKKKESGEYIIKVAYYSFIRVQEVYTINVQI